MSIQDQLDALVRRLDASEKRSHKRDVKIKSLKTRIREHDVEINTLKDQSQTDRTHVREMAYVFGGIGCLNSKYHFLFEC